MSNLPTSSFSICWIRSRTGFSADTMQWKSSTSTTAVILASNAPEYSSVDFFSSATLDEKVDSMQNFYTQVMQLQGDCPRNLPDFVGNFSVGREASECPTATCSSSSESSSNDESVIRGMLVSESSETHKHYITTSPNTLLRRVRTLFYDESEHYLPKCAMIQRKINTLLRRSRGTNVHLVNLLKKRKEKNWNNVKSTRNYINAHMNVSSFLKHLSNFIERRMNCILYSKVWNTFLRLKLHHESKWLKTLHFPNAKLFVCPRNNFFRTDKSNFA